MSWSKPGCPVLVLPMPLTGTTSPITVLGTAIVNMAELLSAVVLFQSVQPGCPLISAWAPPWPTCAPAAICAERPRTG